MTTDNLIDFEPADLKRPVFRVFTYCRFIETLSEKRLTLVRPRLWDDPFENFILRARFRLPDGKIVQLPASKQLYGQCWSSTKESDAMWRIYAPKKDGVKVRAMANKLSIALQQACHEPEVACFVGKVRYISRLKLDENIAAQFNVQKVFSDSGGREQVRSLLVKRKAFLHEQEVRLICRRSIDSDDDLLHLSIDPVQLFDELIFDPRMTVDDYISKRAEVIRSGFPIDRIKRSGLYGEPNLVFDVTN